MRSWTYATQFTNIVMVGISSFFLICGPSVDAEVRPAKTRPQYIRPTNAPLVVDSSVERAIEFKRLVAMWREERGATSTIHEMCTTPAYLSILAMGPDALPLIFGQLRSEGDDPDHWFFALHQITKGVDPVAAEDKGDMVKMSHAWLRWAELEGHVR